MKRSTSVYEIVLSAVMPGLWHLSVDDSSRVRYMGRSSVQVADAAAFEGTQ